jgi:nitroreductase
VELSEAVFGRRMIRTYRADQPVPRETVERLLALAVRAPSAGHTQGWQFLVLDDITSRDRFWTACSADADESGWLRRLRTAPVLVVAFADKAAYLDRYAEPDKGWTDRSERRWPIPYWYVDTGMAAMILLLAAEDAGLAACFFGVPGDAWGLLRDAFGVPDRLDPVGVISLGHAASDRRSPSLQRGRRPLPDVVAYGSFAG